MGRHPYSRRSIEARPPSRSPPLRAAPVPPPPEKQEAPWFPRGPLIWSGKRDLNPRPSPWQGDALPLSYSRIRRCFGFAAAAAVESEGGYTEPPPLRQALGASFSPPRLASMARKARK